MKIRIQVVVSRDRSFEVALPGPQVVIGRDPDCELPLNGDAYQGVSWRHAQIDLLAERACLSDLGSTNGTFLNDERVNGRAPLRKGHCLQLGRMGPTLRIVEIDLRGAPERPPPPKPRPKPPATFKEPEPAPPPPAPGGGVFVPVPTALPVGIPDPVPTGTETGTHTREALQQLKANQRRMLFGGVAAVLGLFALVAVVGVVTLVVMLVRSGGMSEKDAAEIYKDYGEAVYLVEMTFPDGDGAYGTAFAIHPNGLFATNAHVAQPIQEQCVRGKGEAYLVSQGGRRRLRVIDAVWHPEYRGRGGPDVGLLLAELPPGDKVPVTAPIAERADLEKLEVGSPLCYIGFPQFEGAELRSNPGRVNARVYQGRLNRLMTLSEEVGTFDSNHLLEHDMYSWGGASGSPIFDKQGKVVAIHFAATAINREQQAASPKLGIRIDMLTDLMKKILDAQKK